MASARKRAANRANAGKSTGPRTAAGKARVARNARRHGLNRPVAGVAALAGDVEAIARAICGLGAAPAAGEASDPVLRLKLHLARRIAEAQVDLTRVRRARHDMLAQALANPSYRSWRGLKPRIEMLSQAGELMALGIPLPPEMAHAFQFRHEGPAKFALVLADHSAELLGFRRYEGRAVSRRKLASRALDEAELVLADRAAQASSIDASSELSLDLSLSRLLEGRGRRPRLPALRRIARCGDLIRSLLKRALAYKPCLTAPARRPEPEECPRHAPPSPELGRHGEGAVAFWRNKAKEAKAQAAAARAQQADKYANMSYRDAARRIRELLWPTGPPEWAAG